MTGVLALLATEEPSPESTIELNNINDVWELLRTSIMDMAEGFIANLPVYLIALVVFLIGLVLVRMALRAAEQGVQRGGLDPTIQKLALTFARLFLMLILIMVALSIAGIAVGPALAGLGVLGLAFAFAFQNILENFIAGLLILIRKPFRIGDQIITDSFEGTVADINMRVTRLTTYDGVVALVPNSDVFRNPLINLTERGSRRTTVDIGIDYRDDHTRAAEVIRTAIADIEGVLPDPPAEVLLTGLGDSSVDFEIRYWTLPDTRSVRYAQDRVLTAAKSAVEAAGMTIPWPIRTLEPGAALRIRTDDSQHS